MIIPIKEKVLIKEITDTQTASGLFLPEIQKDQPLSAMKGEILSIGPEVFEVKTGNIVYFNHQRAKNLGPLNGTTQDHWILDEKDIIACLE